MKTLYKYRNIKDFKYFVDIIVNSRLYAAVYEDLNDPMEGIYYYRENDFDESFINLLKAEKKTIGICSLTSDPDNYLMWALYADGARGAVIEVEIDERKIEMKPISYTGSPMFCNADITDKTAVDILSHKHKHWEHEKEVRAFTDNGSKFIDVKVKKVIAGSKMIEKDYCLIRKLIKKISNEIEVVQNPKPNP